MAFPALVPSPSPALQKPARLKWKDFVVEGWDFRSPVRQPQPSPASPLQNHSCSNSPGPRSRSFPAARAFGSHPCCRVPQSLHQPPAERSQTAWRHPNEGQARVLCALINKKNNLWLLCVSSPPSSACLQGGSYYFLPLSFELVQGKHPCQEALWSYFGKDVKAHTCTHICFKSSRD